MRRWWLLIALGFIPILAYAFDIVRVNGTSMVPSLCDTDLVVARRLWLNENLQGKLVVADRRDGTYSLKRVLASGGDHFRIVRGSSIRNNVQVAEPYVCETENSIFVNWPEESSRGEPQAVMIPVGSAFLLGDNRTESGDSRTWGAVSVTDLRGVVVARFPEMFQQSSCHCGNLRQPVPES